MTYKLAVFDLDGTLADTFPWFMRVLNDFAASYRFKPVKPDEVDALRRLDSRGIIRHLGIPGWKLPWIARGMRRRMSRELEGIRLFPGVDLMLETVQARGVRLALVTSNSEENARRILGAANASRFDHLRCGVSIFGKRPQIRKVLRQAGVEPGEALYIGDELRDLEASRAEGLAFAAASWGYNEATILKTARPDHFLESMEEIAGLFSPAGRRP